MPRTGRPLKPLNMSLVVDLFAEGKTMRQIEEVTSVVHTTVSRRLKKIWIAEGFRSAKEYRSHLRRSRRPRRTLVIIRHHHDGTSTYRVIGKRVVRG